MRPNKSALVAVKCPKCQTVFYKKKTETGKKEICPICHKEVVFNSFNSKSLTPEQRIEELEKFKERIEKMLKSFLDRMEKY